MSFKSLLKQYAGGSKVLKKLDDPVISATEESRKEEQQYKRRKVSHKKFVLLFNVGILTKDDSREISSGIFIEYLADLFSKSTYSISFDPSLEFHYDKISGRCLVSSSSRSILEGFSYVVCSMGCLEKDNVPYCFELLQCKIVEENDCRLSDITFVSSLFTSIASPSISIVVARYRESISWIPSTLRNRTFLYNKSPLPGDQSNHFFLVSNLPNVGRESHTYLHHIIENYENLSDIVYFTQAHPFDHAPHFISAVQSNIGMCKPYQGLSSITATVHNLDVRQYEPMFPGIQEGFNRTVKELFGADFEQQQIRFYPGAIMAVHKTLIRRRSLDFYRKCMSLLDYSVDPIEGYTFERIWSIIFDDRDESWPCTME